MLLPNLQGAYRLPGNIQVFGTTDAVIGDKAGMFVEHADAIARSGFSSVSRVVFAEDRLDTILRHNKIADGLRDFHGSNSGFYRLGFPPQLCNEIAAVSAEIRNVFGDVPVVIRSSAMGDARGTGVYKSRHVRNAAKEITSAMRDVLSSYFAGHARIWRSKVDALPGFAIIIEPQVGQEIPYPEGRRMAPLMTGMGYSSSGIGPGFIKVTFGMGGGAGARLTRAAMETYGHDAQKYFFQATRSNLLFESVYLGDDDAEHGFPIHAVERDAFAPLLEGISFEPLFEGLERLQETLAKPVYAEWALNAPERRSRHSLTQLATVSVQEDKWEFGHIDNVLLTLNDVRRGQDLEIGAIVFIEHRNELGGLAAWNAENSAYLLVYGRGVIGSAFLNHECPLQLEHIANASAMMMAPNVETSWEWEEHLRGLSESVGMMIGKGNHNDIADFLHMQKVHCDVEHGLLVYRRPMRIRYSSSKAVAVVTP